MSTNIEQEQSGAGSSSSSADPREYESKIAEIDKLVAEGKKLQIAGELEEALDKLSSANDMASNYFGTFADECFLPIFYYGKALIDAARSEVQDMPFKATMNDIEEEDESDPSDNEPEPEGTNQAVNKTTTNGINEGEHVEIATNGINEEEHVEIATNGINEEEHVETALPDTECNGKEPVQSNGIPDECSADVTLVRNGEAVDMDDEMDANQEDIEIAWNCLEIARKICEKQEQSPFWLERMSDVRMALGDCCCVSEDFEQALYEFFTALDIRQKVFTPNDRRIAEVQYIIGYTYKNMNEFTKAADQFEKTKQTLLNVVEEKQLNGTTDPVVAEEIVELKQIIESVEESIQDAIDSSVMRDKQISECNNEKQPEVCKLLNSDGVEPDVVNDLTGMIKRKPKRNLDEDGQMNGANQIKSCNGNSNGMTAKLEEKTTSEVVEPQQKRAKYADEEKVLN